MFGLNVLLKLRTRFSNKVSFSEENLSFNERKILIASFFETTLASELTDFPSLVRVLNRLSSNQLIFLINSTSNNGTELKALQSQRNEIWGKTYLKYLSTSVQITMSSVKEVKVQIKSFLGSGSAYWHGKSLRIVLPRELVNKLNLMRTRTNILFDLQNMKFLFFETDKGILLKIVDKETEEKLKNVIQFASLSELSEEDLKTIFG